MISPNAYLRHLVPWRDLPVALLACATLACSTPGVEQNTDAASSDTESGTAAATSEASNSAGSESAGTTVGASTNISDGTDPSAGSDTTGTTGGDTTEPLPTDCDPFLQDCPEGSKCAPYDEGGGPGWTDHTCVPVDADPGAQGEPCMDIGEPYDGQDTCDVGLLCWNIDPDTMQGTCEPLCMGSIDAPECPDDYYCAVSGDSALSLCIETCDPLDLGACDDNEVCVYAQGANVFACALAGDMIDAGKPCEFLNVCAPGLFCADSMQIAGCDEMFAGCCTPLCDLENPNCDAVPGNECVPFFDPQEPDYPNLGVCVAP